MKTIDFTKIATINVDGSTEVVDFSKKLASSIYATTKEVGEAEFAMSLFRGGEVTVSEDMEEVIRKHIAFYPYALRSAVEKALDNGKNISE